MVVRLYVPTMGFRLPGDPASPLQWARLLDRASHDAAGSTETLDDAGWILRYSPLGFLRNCSAWPVAARGADATADRLRRVVEFYESRDAAPQLWVSPAAQPLDLAAALTENGWEPYVTTLVLARAAQLPAGDPGEVVHDTSPTERTMAAWIGSDARVAGDPNAAERWADDAGHHIFSTTTAQGPSIVRAHAGDRASGVAVAGLWVPPARRRTGEAKALMDAVHRWAHEKGAPRTWLQVVDTNAAALGLYRSLGYDEVYRYRGWRPVG